MFPGRTEVPKTLVFAKSDSHADDVIQMIREEFGESNEFCKKVTYKSEEDPKSVLSQFRNDYSPRIAVTVDMIATGPDVKPTSLAPLAVWQAYERLEEAKGGRPVNELTALVGLIRRVAGLDEVLTTHQYAVDRNFQRWVFEKQAGAAPKFSEAQMEWLRMIKEHVVSSFHIEAGDLEYAPFDGRGGLAEMYGLFGEEMDGILEEMNEALVA
ncbi:MAG: type I restriction-modification enzyme R subunit C-terminal domain-containing protein [Phormidesmis sp.]